MKTLKRQPDLVQVITAGNASGRLTRRLDCRQQQRDQDADDRNHHQQFDERKARLRIQCAGVQAAMTVLLAQPSARSSHAQTRANRIEQLIAFQQERPDKPRQTPDCSNVHLSRPLPPQRTASLALVGLLTSEFGLSSLLVVTPAGGPAYLKRQWLVDWTNLKTLGYSGGGRPGIAPGSLYVGPPTGVADHQRTKLKA